MRNRREGKRYLKGDSVGRAVKVGVVDDILHGLDELLEEGSL